MQVIMQDKMREVTLGVVLISYAATTTMLMGATAEINDGCLRECGNVSIPYPFGTTDECRLNTGQWTFSITCNTTFHPPKPFLGQSNIEVTNISLNGEIDILHLLAYRCYDGNGSLKQSLNTTLRTGNFTISRTKSKFMAMGCDTYAVLRSWLQRGSKDYFNVGCMTYCSTDAEVEDSCSGIGCCQTPIPRRLWHAEVRLKSAYYNSANVSGFNNCSYAFVTRSDFEFKKEYLRKFKPKRVPLLLDWAIGNQTCEDAARNQSSFLCKANSNCFHRTDQGIPGYNCKCRDGYQGNPYLQHPHHGCKDIDECSDSRLNDCEKICNNTPGHYTCRCPKGYRLQRDGKSCSRNNTHLLVILLATGLGFFALLLSILGLCDLYRQRKKTKQKHKYFQQNGGMLLRQKLTGSGQELIKIFSVEELMKATRNYHESRILGKGGQGTVYKGILADNTPVAIKKSRIGDAAEVDQFVKEIFLLSQIKHDNVVKILGCCLETEVPLLVSEFIEHGSLSDRMHISASHHDNSNNIPWRTRLKIASQTASALSHLHSATPPIVHRDVKLANILLDENYNAKVSDFGASRLMPVNRSELTTLVQGTMGYLDPEYFHTHQLTEKSDVYSFGVVLIELLTGQKVLDFERPKADINIALRFISLMKEDRLLEILDSRLLEVADESVVKQLKEVAHIARTCVRMRGEERPTMLEIGHELEGLKELGELPFRRTNLKTNLSVVEEESDHLLGDLYKVPLDYEEVTSSSTGFDSINKKVMLDIESAR